LPPLPGVLPRHYQGDGGIGAVVNQGDGGIGAVVAVSHGDGGIGAVVMAEIEWAVKAFSPIALVRTSSTKTTTTNHLDMDPSE